MDVVQRRRIKVELRGTEWDGYVSFAESLTVAEYEAVIGKGDAVILAAWAEHLLDWNFTQDGEPVPPSAEAVRGLDSSLALSMAVGWLNAVTKVSRDRPLVAAETTTALEAPPAVTNGAVQMDVLP